MDTPYRPARPLLLKLVWKLGLPDQPARSNQIVESKREGPSLPLINFESCEQATGSVLCIRSVGTFVTVPFGIVILPFPAAARSTHLPSACSTAAALPGKENFNQKVCRSAKRLCSARYLSRGPSYFPGAVYEVES